MHEVAQIFANALAELERLPGMTAWDKAHLCVELGEMVEEARLRLIAIDMKEGDAQWEALCAKYGWPV